MNIAFENESISKIIPPAKKTLPAPKFISNNASNTYGYSSPILIGDAMWENHITINQVVTAEKINDAMWENLTKDLIEFIKTTDSETMKEISEEALWAVREKDSGKFKKILANAGKVGIEIFSKFAGATLSELAKQIMF